MVYDAYEARIQRIARVLNFIRDHIVAILSCIGAIILAIAFFLFTKGMIIEDTHFDDDIIIYGEKLEPFARVMFGKASYEYYDETKDEWTKTPPSLPGEHLVRAVTTRAFGITDYGVPLAFTILKKEITVFASSDTMTYGDAPGAYSSGLVSGDRIDSIKHSLVGIGTEDVTLQYRDAVIVNSVGDDVSAGYEITYSVASMTVLPRNLGIGVLDKSREYDSTPLSSEEWNIVSGNFAEGDIAELVFSASITEPGRTDNEPAITVKSSDGTDVTGYYSFDIKVGGLEVLRRRITVKTDSASKVYDAKYMSAAGAQTIDDNGLVTGHRLVVPDSVPTIVNVSESRLNEFEVTVVDADGRDVTAFYDIVYDYGALEITPYKLEVKTDSDSRTYNAQPLSNLGYVMPSLFEGHVEVVSRVPEIIGVGDLKNEIGFEFKDADGNDITSNYEIVYKEENTGILTVAPYQITVTTGNETKEYDGEPYIPGNIAENLGSAFPSGHTVEYSAMPDQSVAVGETSNGVVIRVSDEYGNDVTDNFEINHEFGKLNITKRRLSVQTATDSKIYDGTPLSNTSLTADRLLVGHSAVADTAGFAPVSVTDVAFGIVNNIPVECIRIMAGDEDLTANYEITVTAGYLSVEKRPVILVSGDAEKIYDAAPLQKKDGITLSENSAYDLLAGHTAQILSSAERTDAGSVPNSVSDFAVRSGENDVTRNYDITFEEGTLTVIPRPVTVTTDSGTKVYDAAALTANGFTVTEGTAVSGHEIVLVYGDGITEVGVQQNDAGASVMAGARDVTENYDVTVIPGTLEITKRPLHVMTGSDEKVYDATVLTKEDYDIEATTADSGLVSGQTENLIFTGYIINVGTAENTAVCTVSYGERDVTHNYEIIYTNGTLTVTKRAIHITSGSSDKEYDDIPLTDTTYTASNIVDGHIVNITDSTALINAGTAANKIIRYNITDGYSDVTENYSVTTTWGTLTVTKRPLTIVSATSSKVYADKPLTDTGYTADNLVLGHVVNVISSASITDVGYVTNRFITYNISADTRDVTGNYEITEEWGTLTVTRRPITVAADSLEKVYDDTPLVATGVEWTLEDTDVGLIGGHVIKDFSVYGEITDAGTQVSTVSDAKIYSGDRDVTDNYDITYADGLLTVTQRPITITAGSAEKVYDDTELSVSGYDYTKQSGDVGLLSHQTIESVTLSGSITDAGSAFSKAEGALIRSGDRDVTGNYDITYVDGLLTVKQRPITLTTGSAEKTYDATPLTNNAAVIYTLYGTDKGLLTHHTLDAEATGSITDVLWLNGVVSSTSNSIRFKICSGDTDVTKNYDVTLDLGELTVNPIRTTIAYKEMKVEYNGGINTPSEYWINDSVFVSGHTLQVSFHTGLVDVGEQEIAADLAVYDKDGADVTSNYVITPAYTARIIVLPRAITVAVVSETIRVGEAATYEPSYKITQNTLADRHTVGFFDCSGGRDTVGEAEIRILMCVIIDESGRDVTSNYEITYVSGKLTVIE